MSADLPDQVQIRHRTHSVVSMYSRKDDIVFVTNQEDLTQKILNSYGNEIEVEMVIAENKDENDFILLGNEEAEQEHTLVSEFCSQLQGMHAKLSA